MKKGSSFIQKLLEKTNVSCYEKFHSSQKKNTVKIKEEQKSRLVNGKSFRNQWRLPRKIYGELAFTGKI